MTWSILALLLTGAGGAATWWAFTRRGSVAGTAALGWTLLVPAAWLTGVLQLVSRVSSAVARWATHLAFDLTFWAGIVLGGIGALLIVTASALRARGSDTSPAPGETRAAPTVAEVTGRKRPRRGSKGGSKRGSKSGATGGGPGSDDDLSDIEALLRKRGIE